MTSQISPPRFSARRKTPRACRPARAPSINWFKTATSHRSPSTSAPPRSTRVLNRWVPTLRSSASWPIYSETWAGALERHLLINRCRIGLSFVGHRNAAGELAQLVEVVRHQLKSMMKAPVVRRPRQVQPLHDHLVAPN